MTTPAVWISTTTSELTFDDGTPGHHWQLVGTIDTAEETDMAQHIRMLLGRRSTSPDIPGFYLSATPDNTWAQTAKQDPASQQPFWLAIEPWGRSRPHIRGARETYFVSNEKAAVTKSLKRRPPGPHPGKTIRPLIIGIKVTPNSDGLFTARHKPEND